MSYGRLWHRAVVVLSVVLVMVGCGVNSQETGEPLNTTSPIAPAQLDSPLPSATPPVEPATAKDSVSPTIVSPVAIPESKDSGYQVVLVSIADVQVEIPETWVSEATEGVWSPQPGDVRRIGVRRADLTPPEEAEAVLLPENAQILESMMFETPLGAGRLFKFEVYGAAQQGDDAKADVASVEMHVLVVVTAGDQRTGYDFFAAAPTDAALEPILGALWHMVETAKQGIVMTPGDSYSHIAAVDSAKTRLAEHLSISEDAIQVVSAEAVDWRDACIGIQKPGQMCAQVITPGYRIIADVNGQSYEVHTNTSGSVVGIVP